MWCLDLYFFRSWGIVSLLISAFARECLSKGQQCPNFGQNEGEIAVENLNAFSQTAVGRRGDIRVLPIWVEQINAQCFSQTVAALPVLLT